MIRYRRRISEPAFPAVNYSIAVDESASLAPEDMKAEKAAAARIALGDVSSSSHATVFGFAAAESDAQRAVDPVCPRTTLDAAGRETVRTSSDKLRGRTKNKGTGTDFPSAIRQGVPRPHHRYRPLPAPRAVPAHRRKAGRPGQPQVRRPRAPQGRGRTAADAGARERRRPARTDLAARLRTRPGQGATRPDRRRIQKGCVELPSARPSAGQGLAKDVGPMLEKIFAAAHCLRHEQGPSKRPPATLEIGISPLATVGSIVVDKGDPQVKITYLDPNGHQVPTTGTYRKSGFELAGGSGTVEALKIVDPVPGTWRVKAGAGPPLPARRRQRAVAGRVARRHHHGPTVPAGRRKGHGDHAPADPRGLRDQGRARLRGAARPQ